MQDPSKLENGGLYLDRQVQAKHLWLGGTKYSEADVDRLWARLCDMAGLDLQTLQPKAA